MRRHPSRDAELAGIIKDYADVAPELIVTVGNLDVTDRIEAFDLTWESGSAPWTLTLTLTGRLPTSLRNAPVRATWDIGGITMPAIEAHASRPEGSDDWSTTLSAWTPGFLLDKKALRETVEYSSRAPQSVIYDAVFRIPFYDRSRIHIPAFDKPYFTRIREDAFKHENFPADILSAVSEEIDCVYHDTEIRGFVAAQNPGIGEGFPVSFEYEYDAPDVYEWVEPSFLGPEEQFTEVAVISYNDNGSVRILEEWPVDYSSLPYPPAAGQTLYIPVDAAGGVSQADLDAGARAQAVETAKSLGRGSYEGSMSVALNVRVQPYDVITVFEEHSDDTGRYQRLWRRLVTGISHTGYENIGTSLSFTDTLIRETRISEPPPPLAALSSGVLFLTSVPGLKPNIGLKAGIGLKPQTTLVGPIKPGLKPRIGLKPAVGLKPRAVALDED